MEERDQQIRRHVPLKVSYHDRKSVSTIFPGNNGGIRRLIPTKLNVTFAYWFYAKRWMYNRRCVTLIYIGEKIYYIAFGLRKQTEWRCDLESEQKSKIKKLFIYPIYKLHWVFFNIYLQTYGSGRYLLRQLTLPLVQTPPQPWKKDTKYHILYQNNNMLLQKKKQINNKNN